MTSLKITPIRILRFRSNRHHVVMSMPHIYKCLKCNEYTLKEKCPRCGSETVRPLPPRFSPEDKYGKWRRLAKLSKGGSNTDVV